MATRFSSQFAAAAAPVSGSLADPARAILGPKRDALLFWGAPLAAFLFVQLWLRGWDTFVPAAVSSQAVIALFGFVSVLTWAHLIAVVPRAYLNREVFTAYKLRLTIVPALLLAALFASHTALVAAAVLAVFWDVHHSAMQNFGFARIYDMKAGNAPNMLRATDLRLNWALYVGPLAAGAALAVHTVYFKQFDGTLLSALTSVPGVLDASHAGIRLAAMLAYAVVIGWAVIDYAGAIRSGYKLPAHKLATIIVTGAVSILAWGFSPPLVALAAINLYHAVQYFALVWVKEGGRMAGKGTALRGGLLFGLGCAMFGLAYAAAVSGRPTLFVAPFIACSLLHFWYDSFVWSVRKRQV
ncbi:MAG: hypothetical protein KF730_01910 [Sphingomonas sp.]|uniref:hypothetical protein n=1 Tax=Sphingomonas sp. TaxID=28214 RepID=UPI0025FBDA0F|nr:hypothetical protein [Sphingomonas sp.]MBX3563308.1 hypothetical protein [Sphingomonas sp.]